MGESLAHYLELCKQRRKGVQHFPLRSAPMLSGAALVSGFDYEYFLFGVFGHFRMTFLERMNQSCPSRCKINTVYLRLTLA